MRKYILVYVLLFLSYSAHAESLIRSFEIPESLRLGEFSLKDLPISASEPEDRVDVTHRIQGNDSLPFWSQRMSQVEAELQSLLSDFPETRTVLPVRIRIHGSRGYSGEFDGSVVDLSVAALMDQNALRHELSHLAFSAMEFNSTLISRSFCNGKGGVVSDSGFGFFLKESLADSYALSKSLTLTVGTRDFHLLHQLNATLLERQAAALEGSRFFKETDPEQSQAYFSAARRLKAIDPVKGQRLIYPDAHQASLAINSFLIRYSEVASDPLILQRWVRFIRESLNNPHLHVLYVSPGAEAMAELAFDRVLDGFGKEIESQYGKERFQKFELLRNEYGLNSENIRRIQKLYLDSASRFPERRSRESKLWELEAGCKGSEAHSFDN